MPQVFSIFVAILTFFTITEQSQSLKEIEQILKKLALQTIPKNTQKPFQYLQHYPKLELQNRRERYKKNRNYEDTQSKDILNQLNSLKIQQDLEEDLQQALRFESDRICKATGRCGCHAGRCGQPNKIEGRTVDDVEQLLKQLNKKLDEQHNQNFRSDEDLMTGIQNYHDGRGKFSEQRQEYEDTQQYDERRQRQRARILEQNDRRQEYNDRRQRLNDRKQQQDDDREDYGDRRQRYDDRRQRHNERNRGYYDRRERQRDRKEDDGDRKYRQSDRKQEQDDRHQEYNDRRLEYEHNRQRQDERKQRYVDNRQRQDDRRQRYEDRKQRLYDKRQQPDDKSQEYSNERREQDERRQKYDDRRQRQRDYKLEYDRRQRQHDRSQQYDDRRQRQYERRQEYFDRRQRHGDRGQQLDDKRQQYDDRKQRQDDRNQQYEDRTQTQNYDNAVDEINHNFKISTKNYKNADFDIIILEVPESNEFQNRDNGIKVVDIRDAAIKDLLQQQETTSDNNQRKEHVGDVNLEDFVKYYEKVKRDMTNGLLKYIKGLRDNSYLSQLLPYQKKQIEYLKKLQFKTPLADNDLKEKIIELLFGTLSNIKLLPHSKDGQTIYIPQRVHAALPSYNRKITLRSNKRLFPFTFFQKQRQRQLMPKNIILKHSWRRNNQQLPGYGVPFDLQIQGLGQIN